MRVGTIVRNNRAIGHTGLSEIGVLTTVAGSAGHAGFKFAAWETAPGDVFIRGDFTRLYLAQKASDLSDAEKAIAKRIKARLKSTRR